MSQKIDVLIHLQDGKSLTPVQALNKYGIGRLAARICELRQAGFDIERRKKRVKTKKGRYAIIAEYRMV